jgi:gentisate 1,2-dioxygenase
VPTCAPVSFETDEETVLFEMSDRTVQEAFDLWREGRL